MIRREAKRLPLPLVDFHVHLFPDRMFDAIRRKFVSDYGWNVLHTLYWRGCLDYLRGLGVGSIVYSNYAHREGVARGLNEWNQEILSEVPDLYCFAAFHPDDRNALSMAADLLDNPRILGFKLQLLVQRFSPDDERLFPLCELVMAKQKRLLFHVGTGPVGNEFVGAARFRKLLSRYPNLPAIVAHMGSLEYGAFGEILADHPQICLDTAFAFLPKLGSMCDLGKDFLEKNSSRIIYGSDFPNIIFPREDEVDTLLGFELSQNFYDAVFRDNGLRLIRECTSEPVHARP